MDCNGIEIGIYGFIVGFLWNPTWQILKKIWSEAKLANKEWNNPK